MSVRKKLETKFCAIYGRVSDDDATEVDHGSLEQQEHMGRAMAMQLTESTGIKHVVKYMLIQEKVPTFVEKIDERRKNEFFRYGV